MLGLSPIGSASRSTTPFGTPSPVDLSATVVGNGGAVMGAALAARTYVAESWTPVTDTDPINIGTHDSTSALTYAISWRYVVADADAIVAANVAVMPVGPVVSGVVWSGTTVSWTVGAGAVPGVSYSVVMGITTVGGTVATRYGQFDGI